MTPMRGTNNSWGISTIVGDDMDDDNTADPDDDATWELPCWSCGHAPGIVCIDEYACCPGCGADYCL